MQGLGPGRGRESLKLLRERRWGHRQARPQILQRGDPIRDRGKPPGLGENHIAPQIPRGMGNGDSRTAKQASVGRMCRPVDRLSRIHRQVPATNELRNSPKGNLNLRHTATNKLPIIHVGGERTRVGRCIDIPVQGKVHQHHGNAAKGASFRKTSVTGKGRASGSAYLKPTRQFGDRPTPRNNQLTRQAQLERQGKNRRARQGVEGFGQV